MRILLFVSDIMGTIDLAKDEDLERLAEQLNLLKGKSGADEVLFCLCTGDSSTDYLKRHYQKIKPILEKAGIVMARQFYNNGYLENGSLGKEIVRDQDGSINKIETIISYARQLQSDSEVVAVYYTDDSAVFNATKGYVESELDGKVYYHFISIGNNQNISSYGYSSSMEGNIHGVIQGLSFHLGTEEIREANRKYWIDRKKRLEEERIAKENEKKEEERKRETQRNEEREKERLKQETFKNKQFVDFTCKPIGEDYNSWIQMIKGKYFGNVRVGTIFDGNYKGRLDDTPEEWSYKPDENSYSLSEIMTILGYIDILDVLFLYCNDIREEELHKYYCESGVALCGVSKIAPDRVEAPLSDEDSTNLYVRGEHRINIIEFLMRKEKISLYSLVDTVIHLLSTLYGDISGVTLRKNSSIKEDLLKRLKAIRESKQYNEINISSILSAHRVKVHEKEFASCPDMSEIDEDMPF